MLLVVGLILIPIILLIIKKANSFTTKKLNKILLNLSLILISIIFIILCFTINSEPLDFKITYSIEYMFYKGDYLLDVGIIFIFTPFMWIILGHFLRMIFRSIRIKKNSIIKKDEDYIYYRGDLDKVSPNIIMFVSTLNVDLKKSISSTILKLKLTDYIKESHGNLICTDKDETSLLESEKIVLNLIRTNTFDKANYIRLIEEESLKNKYIVKNHKKIIFRLLKIILAILFVVVINFLSIKLDDYTFKNYQIMPNKNGHTYIILRNKKDIYKLSKEVTDKNDYYSRTYNRNGKESIDYSIFEIRADKLEYSVVRKAFCLHFLSAISIGFIEVFVSISLYAIIEQLIYIKKNYRRTIKGKSLLNKAYALKNYLKKYSLIKERTEKELVLWEYYLVYAIILDVNVKLEDALIEKYVKDI